MNADDLGSSTPPTERPSLVVPATLFVVALLLAVAGAVLLGVLRPPGSRSASLAPPGTIFYTSVFVEPSVGQRRALDELTQRSSLEEVLPEGDIVARIANGYLAPLGLDYARNVDPWLGREAGMALTRGPDGGLHAAIFLEAADPRAAEDHLGRASVAVRERTHRDVSYRTIPRREGGAAGGWAFGVVGDFVLVATPPAAFEAVVDAAQGPALADEAAFDAAMEPLPDDRLAALYVGDTEVAAGLAMPPAARAIAEKLAAGDRDVAIGIRAESDALVLEASEGEPVRLEADILAALIRNLPIGR